MIKISSPSLQVAINRMASHSSKGLNVNITSGMKRLGRILAPMVQQRTPKRSGNLRRSITHRVRRKGFVFFLLVGALSKKEGNFEGKKTVSHKIGHFVTGKRKSFVQNIAMFPGKVLVLRRKLVDGKQVSIAFRKNRRKLAYLLQRRVGAHRPNNIFDRATKFAQSQSTKFFTRLLQ